MANLITQSQLTDQATPSQPFQYDGIAMVFCDLGAISIQISANGTGPWYNNDHAQTQQGRIFAEAGQALPVRLFPNFHYRLMPDNTSTGAVYTV